MPSALVLTMVFWVSHAGASPQAPATEWPPAPPEISVEALPSLVRLIHLPPVLRTPAIDEPGGVVIAFGFGADLPPEGPEQTLHGLVRSWLFASVPARSVELIAHLGGGTFQIVEHPSLTGLRVRVPPQQVAAVVEQVALFLDQELTEGDLLDYVMAVQQDAAGSQGEAAGDAGAGNNREQAVQAVTAALVGGESIGDPPRAEASPELPEASAVVQYFRAKFGTDRAWVIFSERPDAGTSALLNGIDARSSAPISRTLDQDMDIEDGATLTLPSRPEGGLVIGSRIPSVYYEGWFNTLVVDRAIRQALGTRVQTSFSPSRDGGVHLIETPVRLPDYPADVAARIWSDLVMLQSEAPVSISLVDIKQDALAYLARRNVLEWFAAENLWQPLADGWARVWNLTEAEFRSSAGSFLGESRVVASWAPAFDSPTVIVESLDAFVDTSPAPVPARIAPGRVELGALADSPLPARVPVSVEQLASGVSLAAGSPAIFVAGPGPGALPGGTPAVGPNGTLWTFPGLPGTEVLGALSGVRADRLVFFLPSGQSGALRDVLAEWSGGRTDATSTISVDEVATIDLPALVILKVWLDRKVIEAGWSGEVGVGIRATEGSRLWIEADTLRQEQIERWLEGASVAFEGEAGAVEFGRLQAASGAYFDQIRRDLQILLSQRAPGGEIPPPDQVPLPRFRNFLEVFF